MDYYRKVAFGTTDDGMIEEELPNEVFVDKMEKILSSYPNIGVPPEPSKIIGNVYLGTSSNAENVSMLKAMHINYVLNCAGTGSVYKFKQFKDLYTPDTGIMGYQELIFDDDESTNSRSYYERAHAFIDMARTRNGNVLIFCPGVSRSGVIALSYMIRNNIQLLKATRMLKDLRRNVLANEAFMRQLVGYARERHMLDWDITAVHAPRYGRKIDKHRIRTAHLPMFL